MDEAEQLRYCLAVAPAIRVPPPHAPLREINEALVLEPFGPVTIKFGPVIGTEVLPEDLILQEVRALDFSPDAFRSGGTLRSVVDFMRRYGALDPDARYDWNLFTHPPMRIGRPNYEKARKIDGTSTEECEALLQLAQCLANHWVRYRDGLPSLDAWEYWRFPPKISSEADAWDGFTDYLNLGLRALAPRVIYRNLGDETANDRPDADINPDDWSGAEPYDLFDALCVQLYRMIVADSDVLTCANEACRKRFTIQRGTAQAEQYRTRGVKYCSRSCARTQSSRESRRRKKAAS